VPPGQDAVKTVATGLDAGIRSERPFRIEATTWRSTPVRSATRESLGAAFGLFTFRGHMDPHGPQQLLNFGTADPSSTHKGEKHSAIAAKARMTPPYGASIPPLMPREDPWTRPLSIAATSDAVIAQSVILPGSDGVMPPHTRIGAHFRP
jgi:hypothetical protein